ncbi:MAG: hypothetical protein IKB70_08830 [Bacilli bacterium]|nr:hypothetical protein [Bacilli bacterium]
MKTKRELKNVALFNFIFYLVCIVAVVTAIVFVAIEIHKDGWSNENIIGVAYSVTTSTIGVAFYIPYSKYLVNRNKEIGHLKIQLDQTLDAFSKQEMIRDFEEYCISKENVERVCLIKDLLKDKVADCDNLSFETLDAYFDKSGNLLNMDKKLKMTTRLTIKYLYKRIKQNRSDRFDDLYRSYKNGNLVDTPKFPLLEMVLPFVATIIGLFVAIYQTLVIEGELKFTVFQYIRVFVAFTFFMGIFAFYVASANISKEKNKIKDIFRELTDFSSNI